MMSVFCNKDSEDGFCSEQFIIIRYYFDTSNVAFVSTKLTIWLLLNTDKVKQQA